MVRAVGGPQGLFCRSEETGSSQKAPAIPGVAIVARMVRLPKYARGSVSDRAEEVEEPKAAEVVVRDLVWKL